MRQIIKNQMTFGNVDISQIKIDPKSRDEIDGVLKGLQYIYMNSEIREKIFKILESEIQPTVSKKTGRPGLDLWKIVVLGVIRQVCGWDYDKLQHAANNDLVIREMLGHERVEWQQGYYYKLQTLKDNIRLLTPELLYKINEIVVKAGQNYVGGKKKEELQTNADSFVVKTDIHYPTDINLLLDSMRNVIIAVARICEEYKITGWRQYEYIINKLKSEVREIQNLKKAGKAHNESKIKKFHEKYIEKSEELLKRAKLTMAEAEEKNASDLILKIRLEGIKPYIIYAEKHIELIDRRVLQGEKIDHSEKIFSIYEPHTRWISKGKAGTPVEFGIAVTILKDQSGFIMEYEIMENSNDVDVAVPVIKRAIMNYHSIKSISLDRGFWSQKNRKEIGELIEKCVMMKKGRLNKMEEAEHSDKEFIKLRKKHSSVESAINGLDHCGLDKCYDHGINGFKRCVALSILARNILTLGKLIVKKEDKQRKRKPHKKAA